MSERGDERRPPAARSVWATLGLALAAFLAVDLGLFWTPLYRSVLAPDSSAGIMTRAIHLLRGAVIDWKRRPVFLLGDSRMYTGIDLSAFRDAPVALVNLSLPGTTPRCWYYYLRDIDPRAAWGPLVIPVDTYADDDSAIGSLDGDDRQFDLHYLAYLASPADAWPIANTFSDPRVKVTAFASLLLRGPLLRDDMQALLADPVGRQESLTDAARGTPPLFESKPPRHESLSGLRTDFSTDRIAFPDAIPAVERLEIENQVLRPVHPSPSYARYRREWLGAIVDRYLARHRPVIFVRIPTRPVHRTVPQGDPTGSIAEFARRGAFVIPQAKYVALERSELFADHDHLNAEGARRFSALLAADVSAILAHKPGYTIAGNAAAPPTTPAATKPAPVPSPFARLAIFFGAGVPIAFQSYEYFLFFAIVAALFYALPRGAGRIVLLCASWYFYARWNAWYLVFILGLTVSDFAVGLWLERAPVARRKLLLALGIAANLAFLGVFKYANFTTGSIASLFGLQHDPWLVNWIVPIGISFHTFQSISYLVDVYRGKMPAVRAPLDYALYIAFFPQLLAGPIVRAGVFFGELYAWRRPSADAALRGIGEIALGLVKKAAIADQLAGVADSYFRNPSAHPGAPAAWSGVLAFAFQIYFDFSGYSDIAIGSARLLGFDFPPNFRRPYLATSISDFWRRWHISLSTWLRDYLYIPLGGNRHGPLATYRNLMLTMLLGGLWHGANWTFIVWGGYHGVWLCLERALRSARGEAPPITMTTLWRVPVTFAIVCVGWVLFRSQNFGEAVIVFRAALAGGAGQWLLPLWMLVPVAIATVVAVAQERGWTPQRLRTSPLAYGGALAALVLALELLSVSGESPPFIYFKF